LLANPEVNLDTNTVGRHVLGFENSDVTAQTNRTKLMSVRGNKVRTVRHQINSGFGCPFLSVMV
jgi:hypothetical protein